MILAAGRGERMRPLTDSRPKPLVNVHGKALIDYHLERLASAGVRRVVINVSWLAEQIEAHVGDGQRYGLQVRYSRENQALETAGGIVQALPLLGEREFLLLNADVYCDNPVPQLLECKLGNDMGRLLLTATPEYLPGDFALLGDRVGQKRADQAAYTYTGLAKFSTRAFARLPSGKRPLRPLLDQAISKARLAGELLQGRWLDVGTPERLAQANQTPW